MTPRFLTLGRTVAAGLLLLAVPASAQAPAAQAPAAPVPAPAAPAQAPDAATEAAQQSFAWGPRTPAQVGSLHRVAAVVEAALDVYRLSLLELVSATKRVREAGLAKGGGPAAPVPPVVLEVYQRLARAVRNRVPDEALPAIGRAYHAEVLDGLGALAAADQVAQTLGPMRVMMYGMERLCDSAHAVIDLYSRARPIDARVVDQGAVFDELSDALDEFAASEDEIRTRRAKRADQDIMAAAFRRTEVALGHLLDVWAAARRLGVEVADAAGEPVVDVQVTPGMATDSLETVTRQVEARLGELDELLRAMEKPPSLVVTGLHAELTATGDGAAEAIVEWPYDEKAAAVAGFRVYRVDDRERTAERVRGLFRCQGLAEPEVNAQTEAALEALGPSSVAVGHVPPGIAAFTDKLRALPVAPPIYRVVAVGAFGAEGRPTEVTAAFVAPALTGPTEVAAKLRAVGPQDESFYRDAGAVDVSWRLSESDAATAAQQTLAAAKGYPVVRSYVVERQSGEHAMAVAVVPSGITSVVDRPPLGVLRAGARYRVRAVDDKNTAAVAAGACGESAVVQADLAGAFGLAAAGMGGLRPPTLFERQAAARLEDEAALQQARAAFSKRPVAAQHELMTAWWQSRPEELRREWLRDLPTLYGKERDAWVRTFDGVLSERDLVWAQAALFVTFQKEAGEDLGPELARWWKLLDEASHAEVMARWRATLDQRHLDWLTSQGKITEDHLRTAEYPGRLLGWWRSRDLPEQRRMALWWSELDPAERDRALRKWFDGLPEAARPGVRWTDWEHRSPAERERLLVEPPPSLPPPLWRDLLAHAAFVDLSGSDKVAAVRREAGVLGAALSGVAYRLRPYDVALSFHLGLWVLGSLLLVATAGVVVRGIVRGRK